MILSFHILWRQFFCLADRNVLTVFGSLLHQSELLKSQETKKVCQNLSDVMVRPKKRQGVSKIDNWKLKISFRKNANVFPP